MTHRVLVQYCRTMDHSAFDQQYHDVHVPLARKIPVVVRFDIGHASALECDTAAYLDAVLDFASAEAFASGMGSPEGTAAAGDVPNFATGGASMSHYDIEDFTP